MPRTITIRLSPPDSVDSDAQKHAIAHALEVDQSHITTYTLVRRTIDARKRQIFVELTYNVYIDEEPQATPPFLPNYHDVSGRQTVLVVGAGPAGLFSALRLIELNLRPVVVERGKDVSARKVDLATLNREGVVDEDSNYAFGEGGAGTFSDGKLFTRSVRRGNVRKILEVFHHHGASDDILIDAHPHIGSDRLPQVVKAMRETIIKCGGEVHFGARMTDIEIVDGEFRSITINNSTRLSASALILATGHSARDVYELLVRRGIAIEQKAWAMGVRVEHPQELIDQIQYHSPEGRGEYLPPATYTFTTQVAGRGVYSFCMCPGGFIVPAMSSPGEMVVNGMSPSRRNSPFANSGIVVEIRPEDIGEYQNHGVLGTLDFQREFERLAFINGGRGIVAPAQVLTDFVRGRVSADLPETSYIPGIVSSPMHFWMPENISDRLRQGFEVFGRQARGFLTDEAKIIGVESRTSSPVRIPRNPETMEHLTVRGLYPCGEGAGYAGGIVSSAIDGELCAEKISEKIS